jgi:hypothetical protein
LQMLQWTTAVPAHASPDCSSHRRRSRMGL